MKRWIAAFVLTLILFVMSGCGNGQTGNQMPAAPTPSSITHDINGPASGISGEAGEKTKTALLEAEIPASEEESDVGTVNLAHDEVSGAVASTVNEEEGPAAGTTDKESIEAEEGDTFRLCLTRDWGTEVLDSRNVIIKPDYNLLNYMKEEWQLDTGFGSEFVAGINGLQSAKDEGNRYDWFFYVNGELSPVGAGQVKPESGDVIYWDYHMWSNSSGLIEDEASFPPKVKES
ncbi:MAG: DUF4430 domain-containing protein [Bacteroidales bacterium]|nr:DUF4430 domain-containing protein [Bacteroidales bacterium]